MERVRGQPHLLELVILLRRRGLCSRNFHYEKVTDLFS